MLAEIERGKDLVFAEYPVKKHSMLRNFGSSANEIMLRMLIGKPKNLTVTSYFACRRFIIDEVVRYRNPYPYVSGLLLRTTQHVSNVPVNYSARRIGKSGYTFSKLLSLWTNGLTAFSVKPLRFASLRGCFFAFIGFVYGLVIVIGKI